jgi:hypothetical protein
MSVGAASLCQVFAYRRVLSDGGMATLLTMALCFTTVRERHGHTSMEGIACHYDQLHHLLTLQTFRNPFITVLPPVAPRCQPLCYTDPPLYDVSWVAWACFCSRAR